MTKQFNLTNWDDATEALDDSVKNGWVLNNYKDGETLSLTEKGKREFTKEATNIVRTAAKLCGLTPVGLTDLVIEFVQLHLKDHGDDNVMAFLDLKYQNEDVILAVVVGFNNGEF